MWRRAWTLIFISYRNIVLAYVVPISCIKSSLLNAGWTCKLDEVNCTNFRNSPSLLNPAYTTISISGIKQCAAVIIHLYLKKNGIFSTSFWFLWLINFIIDSFGSITCHSEELHHSSLAYHSQKPLSGRNI